MVSIITVTYNNADFLPACIESVFAQDESDWEWIVVDNGSKDGSATILNEISDPRVKILTLPENVGVSAGRNEGLKRMNGEFFCFLDGDDILPVKSLSSRLKVFNSATDIDFVDGAVSTFRDQVSNQIGHYQPRFRGNPFERLLSLDGSVFMGNTWMIKRIEGKPYQFATSLTHGEELLFFASICQSGQYDYTEEKVLLYRKHGGSAMGNLDGLFDGYLELAVRVAKLAGVTKAQLARFKSKSASIMFKSYLKEGSLFKGISAWLKLRY